MPKVIEWRHDIHEFPELSNREFRTSKKVSKEVDGKMVPVPHFGVILDWQDFDLLSEKIKESKLEFVIEPYLRFEGKPGEQKTMFFQDPFGNSLEFKSFKSDDEIFKST